MKALAWIGIALVQILLLKLNFIDGVAGVSTAVHQTACRFIERIPSDWDWFLEAVLAGKNDGLKSRPEIESFIVLGIYYLLVVSGIHIHAVEKILRRAFFFLREKARERAVVTGLICYCAINRFQPPCARAIAYRFLSFKKTVSPVFHGDLQLAAACVCLLLEPEWAKSLSFQLACGATLGIAIASSLEFKGEVARRLAATLLCSLTMAPLFFGIQPCLSWLVIPANIVALPFFETAIMPLSMATIFISPLHAFTDFVLKATFGVAHMFSQFEKPRLCLDERKLRAWGLTYLFAVYAVWRIFIPLYNTRRFKARQQPD